MILLHHFTWQQFGIAATFLALIWYGTIWLIYYRKAPGDSHPIRETTKEPLTHRWETGEFQNGNDDELAGGSVEDEGVSTLASDGFHFVAKTKKKDNTEDELRGLIPDVLEEVKAIVHTVEIKNGGKDDFISLFKMVSAKYERLKTSHHLEAINEWIMDNVPFNLTEDEVWSLWD